MADRKVKVCVGNYGYYAEGELHDAWIELPQTPEYIEDFLEKNGLRDERHEETYISDYDGYPLEGCKGIFDEYASLEGLNLLALQLEAMPEAEIDAVESYMALQASATMEEVLNACLQADDIPYYGYEWPGPDDVSPETKYGEYKLKNNPHLKQALEDADAAWAFDTEIYGRADSESGYVQLYDDGYIDCTIDGPDLDFYSWDEIEQEVIANSISANPASREIAEALEARAAARAVARTENEIAAMGVGFYNPHDNKLVRAGDVKTREFGPTDLESLNVYKIKNSEALALSEEGKRASDAACPENLAETIRWGTEEYKELMAELSAESGFGWFYDEPDVLKAVCKAEEDRRRIPVPTASKERPSVKEEQERVADMGGRARESSRGRHVPETR